MFKKLIATTFTAALLTGAVVLGVKIAKDIDESTDEDINYNEKAERYFKEKWANFRTIMDEKNAQIDEIMQKVKEDVVKEVDELRRKEIVQNASKQIAELKDEIRIIAEQRRADLIKLSDKVKKSGVIADVKDAAVKTGRAVKKAISNAMSNTSNEVYEVDSIIACDTAYLD